MPELFFDQQPGCPEGIRLRQWREQDFPTIQALTAAEGWMTPTQRPEESLRAWNASWPVIIAEADSQIVGCLRALSDGLVSTYICELLVVPAWRRRGLGRTLLDACQALVPTTRLDLLAEIEARHFYVQCGFWAYYGFRRPRIH